MFISYAYQYYWVLKQKFYRLHMQIANGFTEQLQGLDKVIVNFKFVIMTSQPTDNLDAFVERVDLTPTRIEIDFSYDSIHHYRLIVSEVCRNFEFSDVVRKLERMRGKSGLLRSLLVPVFLNRF